MKALITAMALAFAIAAAPIAIESAWAVDAHHPKTQTKKTKKVKKKTSATTATPMRMMTMMNCPMMPGGPMARGAMMNCPMMPAHAANMMPGPQRMMMPTEGSMMMNMMPPPARMMMPAHAQMMMSMMNRCWVETDRDRGYGYWGQCTQ